VTEQRFNARVKSTVLAALRYWQREGWRSGGHEHDIASDGGTVLPLTEAEIDVVCEDLNFDTPAPETPADAPPSEMTRALRDEAMAEIYAVAFRTLQRFGLQPDETAAERFVHSIQAYLDTADKKVLAADEPTPGP
jgi:hypothetical protein